MNKLKNKSESGELKDKLKETYTILNDLFAEHDLADDWIVKARSIPGEVVFVDNGDEVVVKDHVGIYFVNTKNDKKYYNPPVKVIKKLVNDTSDGFSAWYLVDGSKKSKPSRASKGSKPSKNSRGSKGSKVSKNSHDDIDERVIIANIANVGVAVPRSSELKSWDNRKITSYLLNESSDYSAIFTCLQAKIMNSGEAGALKILSEIADMMESSGKIQGLNYIHENQGSNAGNTFNGVLKSNHSPKHSAPKTIEGINKKLTTLNRALLEADDEKKFSEVSAEIQKLKSEREALTMGFGLPGHQSNRRRRSTVANIYALDPNRKLKKVRSKGKKISGKGKKVSKNICTNKGKMTSGKGKRVSGKGKRVSKRVSKARKVSSKGKIVRNKAKKISRKKSFGSSHNVLANDIYGLPTPSYAMGSISDQLPSLSAVQRPYTLGFGSCGSGKRRGSKDGKGGNIKKPKTSGAGGGRQHFVKKLTAGGRLKSNNNFGCGNAPW